MFYNFICSIHGSIVLFNLYLGNLHVQSVGLIKHYSSINTEEQPPPGMLRRMWNWFNTYYEEPVSIRIDKISKLKCPRCTKREQPRTRKAFLKTCKMKMGSQDLLLFIGLKC